uniref:Uncharacterized protein n=1 Tax=Attheya septentrionalis TaxID=420275 RepID=A0A7S2URM8_9STRA|mmetsp:Transcript_7115/g.12778  ORF Transcript_7115/g.12778 Transcript_7115/m.12778 type:complete len:141 (+) Transcript_7115:121-543(+)|eukprot:CAMPEP_0198295046 /NCGR_PEP_ID=MMETSP1449-20131203/25538_1 /TAXON_ID=420275 /ORGANISM="Attheya septentrionalis, Strain CCMP2084" /LENGTH=140 /DNA_ID=CAMNT_0043995215 /DNA_START=39 /DNA_END=461 /DNA_ORIENTATION=+
MGVLKHIILPLYALVHASSILILAIKGKQGIVDYVAGMPYAGTDRTLLELHLLGGIAAAHVALLFGDVLGMISKHDHFLTIMTTMDLIYFAGSGMDSYLVGGSDCVPLLLLCVISLFGLLLHALDLAESAALKKKKVKMG